MNLKVLKNKKDIIIYTSFILILLLMVVVINKSYAIYKLEEKYNIIESRIQKYPKGDIEVAVLVDGKNQLHFLHMKIIT